jgi:hypothetical protein
VLKVEATWLPVNDLLVDRMPERMTGFGASGPAEVLYPHFGITAEAIVAEARRLLATQFEAVTA